MGGKRIYYWFTLLLLSAGVYVLTSANDTGQVGHTAQIAPTPHTSDPSRSGAETYSRTSNADSAGRLHVELGNLDGVITVALDSSDKGAFSSIKVPDDPDKRIDDLLESTAHGSADAAYELYALAYKCAPWQPFPRTQDELDEHLERIIQSRQTPTGKVIEYQDLTVDRINRVFELCTVMRERDIDSQAHWNGIAAEMGHLDSMVGYWLAQEREVGYFPDQYSEEQIETIRNKAIEYLETARDTGHVDAFFGIGASMAGIVEGPHEEDAVEGLAHFYALTLLRNELIMQRTASEYYSDHPDMYKYDLATLEISIDLANQIEHSLAAYERESAREIANELIKSCCF